MQAMITCSLCGDRSVMSHITCHGQGTRVYVYHPQLQTRLLV